MAIQFCLLLSNLAPQRKPRPTCHLYRHSLDTKHGGGVESEFGHESAVDVFRHHLTAERFLSCINDIWPDDKVLLRKARQSRRPSAW